jgi:hypothetical protein
MRLRWLILVGASGLIIAWWFANLSAAYVAVFGCLVLRGLRIVQLRLESDLEMHTSLYRAATAGRAVDDRAQLLMSRRHKLVEKVCEATDAHERGELKLQLIKTNEALSKALGFES